MTDYTKQDLEAINYLVWTVASRLSPGLPYCLSQQWTPHVGDLHEALYDEGLAGTSDFDTIMATGRFVAELADRFPGMDPDDVVADEELLRRGEVAARPVPEVMLAPWGGLTAYAKPGARPVRVSGELLFRVVATLGALPSFITDSPAVFDSEDDQADAQLLIEQASTCAGRLSALADSGSTVSGYLLPATVVDDFASFLHLDGPTMNRVHDLHETLVDILGRPKLDGFLFQRAFLLYTGLAEAELGKEKLYHELSSQ